MVMAMLIFKVNNEPDGRLLLEHTDSKWLSQFLLLLLLHCSSMTQCGFNLRRRKLMRNCLKAVVLPAYLVALYSNPVSLVGCDGIFSLYWAMFPVSLNTPKKTPGHT